MNCNKQVFVFFRFFFAVDPLPSRGPISPVWPKLNFKIRRARYHLIVNAHSLQLKSELLYTATLHQQKHMCCCHIHTCDKRQYSILPPLLQHSILACCFINGSEQPQSASHPAIMDGHYTQFYAQFFAWHPSYGPRIFSFNVFRVCRSE